LVCGLGYSFIFSLDKWIPLHASQSAEKLGGSIAKNILLDQTKNNPQQINFW